MKAYLQALSPATSLDAYMEWRPENSLDWESLDY